jgi:hypothetical protein
MSSGLQTSPSEGLTDTDRLASGEVSPSSREHAVMTTPHIAMSARARSGFTAAPRLSKGSNIGVFVIARHQLHSKEQARMRYPRANLIRRT